MNLILAGIDGSPEAETAADQAADLAHSMGANLKIVYVVPPNPPPGPAAYMPENERGELVERDFVAALLRQVELRCAREGVTVDTTTASGPIAETIADLARSDRADLVVVGHRGRGGVRRFLLGSVADRLIQISPTPVLVVR